MGAIGQLHVQGVDVQLGHAAEGISGERVPLDYSVVLQLKVWSNAEPDQVAELVARRVRQAERDPADVVAAIVATMDPRHTDVLACGRRLIEYLRGIG